MVHVESVGSGTPLVLLHGWGMHAGLWSPLLPALAARHRVHAVDLPGHGHSPAIVRMTLQGLATAVAERFSDERDVTVLGWSLGALVALEWARKAPQLVRRLVLVGATPRFVAGRDWPHAMDEITLQRFADELRVAYDATLKRFLALQLQGSDSARALLASMRHQLFARGRPTPQTLVAMLEIVRGSDLRARVGTLLQPALVISGERDTLVPSAAGRWLARHLPRGRFVAIEGAAHVPFLSHAQAFLPALHGFLDER